MIYWGRFVVLWNFFTHCICQKKILRQWGALSQASISSVSPHPHLPSRLSEQIHRCLASSSSNLWDRGYKRRSVSLYSLFTLHYHSTHCLFCLIIVSVFFLSNICISLPTLDIILYIGVIGSTLLEAHSQGKPTPCSILILKMCLTMLIFIIIRVT